MVGLNVKWDMISNYNALTIQFVQQLCLPTNKHSLICDKILIDKHFCIDENSQHQ